MRPSALHFVDPTIPGISGRDLVQKSSQTFQAADSHAPSVASAARRFRVVRKALGHLDTRLLRDLGLDRGAS
jgi:hypothetical protein